MHVRTCTNELVVGMWYWIRPIKCKGLPWKPHQVQSIAGRVCMDLHGMHMWAHEDNNQLFDRYDVYGPILQTTEMAEL